MPKYIKDYKFLDDVLIPQLRQRLSLSADAKAPTDSLVVSIARKGPHLMERAYANAESDYISDIALPFIDTRDIRKLYIVDDAVYYGTTFKRMQALALWAICRKGVNLNEVSTYSCPLVVAADETNTTDQFADILYPYSAAKGLRFMAQDQYLIDKPSTPFYVSSIVDSINESNRPYDIDVPVFDMDYDRSLLPEAIVKTLADEIYDKTGVGVEHYAVEHFNRKDNKVHTAYTIVLDRLFEQSAGAIKPDCAKLRLYFDTDRHHVAIAAYCICPIDERKLKRGSNLFTSEFTDEAWNHLASRALDESVDPDFETFYNYPLWDDDDRKMLNSIRDEYINFAYRSLATMANYMYSYFMFDSIADSLTLIADNGGAHKSLNRHWLKLLVGQDLSDRIINALSVRSWHTDVFNYDIKTSIGKSNPVIPDIYRDAYGKEWRETLFEPNNFSKTDIETGLSVEFGAMHRNIELLSRRKGANIFTRLSFGQSMPSLRSSYMACGMYDTLDDLNMRVNRGVDRRIDSGSIVPVYVRQSDGSFANEHWTQLYHSGENDDVSRDQVMRNLIYVFNYVTASDSAWINDMLSTSMFDFVIWVIVKHAFHYNERAFFGYDIELESNDNKYSVMLSLNGDKLRLYEYAKSCKVLDESYDQLTLCETPYVRSLTDGNTFSKKQEEDVNKAIDAALMYINAFYNAKIKIDQVLTLYQYSLHDVMHRFDVWYDAVMSFRLSDSRTIDNLAKTSYNLIMDTLNKCPAISESGHIMMKNNDGYLHDDYELWRAYNNDYVKVLRPRISFGALVQFILEAYRGRVDKEKFINFAIARTKHLTAPLATIVIAGKERDFTSWIKSENAYNQIRGLSPVDLLSVLHSTSIKF